MHGCGQITAVDKKRVAHSSACHRRHAWREGRAALSVLRTGADRPLPPAAPIEHEQPTGVGAARFDQQPAIPGAGSPKLSGSATSNPKSALPRRPSARDRRHGRARVAWPAGTRPRRLRRPPAEHGLGPTAGRGPPLHEFCDGRVELDEEGVGESRRVRGNRRARATRAQAWRPMARNARIRVASQPTFPSWDGNCRSSPFASPSCPPYRTAAGCRAQSHHNRLIGGLHRAA